MRYQSRRYLTILIGLLAALLLPFATGQAAPASGTFTASQACEAYVSKNKHSNPDQYHLSAGSQYPILETTGHGDSAWFRVRVADAQPDKRWVAQSCGSTELTAAGGSSPSQPAGGSGQCDIANKGDSYVFAVSWQPAFCSTHQNKPECSVKDPQAYQASHFTLHGLWPNRPAQCGTHYGYCGEVKTQPTQFCSYPPVSLSPEAQKDLAVVMPSVAAGSCLDRHEWYKHGTCQTQWNADGYFEMAVDLTKQFNDSGIAEFMAANVGKKVKESDFIAKVDTSLGTDAHNRLHLTCNKSGKLVDVFIDLPGNLGTAPKLADLIAQATPTRNGFSSNCNGQFGVQALGAY
jgi:ribonuclease T2